MDGCASTSHLLIGLCKEATQKGVNQRSKDVTQAQQQRPESPTLTLNWHARQYKSHKLHQTYICYNEDLSHLRYLLPGMRVNTKHTNSTRRIFYNTVLSHLR